MFYVYILISELDKKFYTGYTSDLKQRMVFHNNGECASTKNRRPLRLIYYEACLNKKDAMKREKYLKSSWGKRYTKNRLKECLSNGVIR